MQQSVPAGKYDYRLIWYCRLMLLRPGTKRSDTPKASDDSCFTTSPQFCNLVQCDTCPSNTAPSQDQSICMVCGAGVDPSTKDCLCSANSMLVEYDTVRVFIK